MDWAYVAGYFDGEGCALFRAAAHRPTYTVTGLQWGNTHHGSLIAIQAFMQCGRLSKASRSKSARLDFYTLSVLRCDDVVRVGEALLPHLIIKRDRVAAMIEFVRLHRKPHGFALKRLDEIGADVIRRLYMDDGLSRRDIGRQYGVARQVVSNFMKRHDIYGHHAHGPKRGSHHSRQSSRHAV